MKKVSILLIILFISSFNLNIFALTAGIGNGTTSANFLKLSQGARPSGMGEAFVGVANDVTAIYWNPAGLTQITRNQICLMHTAWLMDVNFEYIAYALPIAGFGTIGGDITFLNAGNIFKTDEDSTGKYILTTEKATASDFKLTLAYAKKLSDFIGQDNPISDLSLGIDLNIISEKVYNDSGGGFSFSLGAFYLPKYEAYSMGLTLENIGMATNRPEMPSIVKFGIGYRFSFEDIMLPFTEEGKFIFADNNVIGDLDLIYDVVAQAAKIHVGAEKNWELNKYHNILIRAGYKFGEDLDFPAGLTAGLGYKLTAAKDMSFELDYVFVPYSDLGSTNRISLTGKFIGVAENKYYESKKSGIVFYKKGYEALYKKDFPIALEAFTESIKRYREYAPAYMGVGSCYLNIGKRDLAMKAFGKAMELDPNNQKLKDFVQQYNLTHPTIQRTEH
ncbi:MAG: PorV/PorQ family protein [bacterium]